MIKNNLLYRIKINSIQLMQTKAERKLNPLRYYLSDSAKKRLRWMYIIYYECDNNISQAANKIGISREWLSKIKSVRYFLESKLSKNSLKFSCLFLLFSFSLFN